MPVDPPPTVVVIKRKRKATNQPSLFIKSKKPSVETSNTVPSGKMESVKERLARQMVVVPFVLIS